MPADRDALRVRATTSSTVVSATSMVITAFCETGAMGSARPGLNRLFTATLTISGCAPAARPIAVAITASVTRDTSVRVRLAMASMARCAAGEVNLTCEYRDP